MRSEMVRLEHENLANDERIKENLEKIKQNDQLPCVLPALQLKKKLNNKFSHLS